MNSTVSLRDRLDYEPVPLKFGTSGRRGLVADLSQLEVYLNALAELEYLQSLPPAAGGIVRGDEFFFACDLRPSSLVEVDCGKVRGALAPAVARAIADAGMRPAWLGRIPTPALANHALRRGRGCIMVTGSHIPFDRNGYKTNSAAGELLKRDEAPIQARVESVRARLYAQPAGDSPFAPSGPRAGMFKESGRPLPPEDAAAGEAYLRRYTDFFPGQPLREGGSWSTSTPPSAATCSPNSSGGSGPKSSPPAGAVFVPIDTRPSTTTSRVIAALAREAWNARGPVDAVVSTDGDSDRPLLGVEPATGADAPCRSASSVATWWAWSAGRSAPTPRGA
ncbi:MAG: hypothetical protein U1F77_18290 [Kiritimatiellia bacterium]